MAMVTVSKGVRILQYLEGFALPLILAAFAALPGLLALLVQRRKTAADTYDTLVSTIERLTEKLISLQSELDKDAKAYNKLALAFSHAEQGIVVLSRQLAEAGIKPLWLPAKNNNGLTISLVMPEDNAEGDTGNEG